ncbi:MAG: RNA recognition motif domain-containing protein [Bacteriovoracaceae bacterium]
MKNKPSDTVYISNLSYERDRDGLKVIFAKYGKVKSIKIPVDENGRSKGMAFVAMDSVDAAKRAIKELNGKIIDGRTAKLNYAIPQEGEGKSKREKGEAPKKKEEPDFKSKQLAKKERNDKKRKSNPLVFKAPSKKKTRT